MRHSNAPKIEVASEDLPEKFRELLWIMHNVRKYKIIWDEHYGVENRNRLRAWEKKADEFLGKMLIEPKEDDGISKK